MRSKKAQAIREARRACGLTQQQLGMRLGLRGRAIYRWERDESMPSRRSSRALVVALQAVNPAVASRLAQALSGDTPSTAALAAAAAAAPPPIDERRATELLVFTMADELDLPPRRVRGALARLLRRMREATLSLDAVQRELQQWMSASA